MNKHTPGPWHVEGMEIVSALGSESGDGCQACDVHSWTIAEISDCTAFADGLGLVELGHGVKQANARLIAAAPDLLDALELADAMLRGANINANVVQKNVTAAIAKARGES